MTKLPVPGLEPKEPRRTPKSIILSKKPTTPNTFYTRGQIYGPYAPDPKSSILRIHHFENNELWDLVSSSFIELLKVIDKQHPYDPVITLDKLEQQPTSSYISKPKYKFQMYLFAFLSQVPDPDNNMFWIMRYLHDWALQQIPTFFGIYNYYGSNDDEAYQKMILRGLGIAPLNYLEKLLQHSNLDLEV